MKVRYLRLFNLDDASAVVDLINDVAGDSVVDEVYLQVSDAETLTLKVQGQIADTEDYTDIAVVNLANMATIASISTDGLYVLSGVGLSGIKLTATGECKVVVKTVA